MILRPYQENLSKRTRLALKDYSRVILQLMTGGGKTAIATDIVDRASSKNFITVFLTDREKILEQTVKHFHKRHISCQLITKETKTILKSNVYVGMVESFYRRYAKGWFKDIPIKLFIMDEAHIGNYYKLLDMIPFDAWVIGLTATPVASSKNYNLSKYYKQIVCGPSTQWLIQNGFLIPSHDIGYHKLLDLNVVAGEFSSESQMSQFKEHNINEEMFKLWKQHAKLKQTLVYNVNIEHNNEVYQMFKNAGYDVGKISSEDSEEDRIEQTKAYDDGRIQILCNVGILTKGYDTPHTECIVANFSTTSLSKWYQVVGRGGRPHPEMDKFITIDMGNNILLHGSFNDEVDWEQIFWDDKRDRRFKVQRVLKLCPLCSAYITNVYIDHCHVCKIPITPKDLKTIQEVVPPVVSEKEPHEMTLSELYEYAKYKGYKKGWAWIQNTKNIAARQNARRDS